MHDSSISTTSAARPAAGADQQLVSIVVRTCRGRLGFLKEALASLLAQTYRALEIVVVEDGSDQAGPLVRRLGAGARHTLVYRSIAKAGRCEAGNVGLAAAAGRMLGFLDDDDRLFPDHVATLARALACDPHQPAAYSLACEVPTQVVSTEPLQYREVARYVVHRRRWRPEEMTSRNFLPIQSVLFRRELFERYGGFDTRLDCLEDWDLWRRYLAAGEFAYVPCVTSLHRVPADPVAAHARFRRLQTHRPTLEAKWAASAPEVSRLPLRGAFYRPTLEAKWAASAAIAMPVSISRRLASRVISYAWPFRLYWSARLAWYARTRHDATGELPRSDEFAAAA